MTLRLRVKDNATGSVIADTFAKSAKVTFGLNKSISWSAEFPVVTQAVSLIETGLRIDIFYLGVLINTGTVQDFTQEYVGIEGFLKLKGRSDLDVLFDNSANSLSYYEAEKVIEALYLLLNDKGWKLGDISTWGSPEQLISNDLSNSKTLVEQVKKILNDADTNLFYRTGDDLFGYPTLDIGTFNEVSGVRFLTPPAGEDRLDKQLPIVNRIKKLTVKTKATDIVGSIDLKGGTLKVGGVEKRLSLREYVDQDYTRFQDPNYPIIELIPFVEYRMYNKALDSYPGGIIKSTAPYDTVYSAQSLIGDFASGVNSRVTNFSFWGIGGRLDHFTVYISSIGASWSEANQASLFWVEVAEMTDPSSPHIATPGATTLLYQTTLASGNFLNTGKWTYTFPLDDDNLILEFGKRYCVRLGSGYANVDGSPWTIEFLGVIDTLGILDQGLRWDWNANQFSSLSVSQRYTIATNIHINPIDSPGYPTIKLTYDQYSPEQDSSDNNLSEYESAADALYARGLSVLRDRSFVREDWSMDAVGNDLVVKPGSTVFVQGTAEKVVVNPASNSLDITRLKVAKNLRVDEVSLSYGKDTVTAKYKLLEGDGITEEDAIVSVYDESKFEPKEKGLYYKDDFWREQDFSTVASGAAVVGSLPDTTMDDGRKAKLVTFNYELPAGFDFTLAELMARPFQFSGGVRIDPVDLELINTIISPFVADTMTPNAYRSTVYGGGSIFSVVTDGAANTDWSNTFAPSPHVNLWTMEDNVYDWVMTEVQQQAMDGSTSRKYMPGSFTIWGSNTGDFSGEEVQLFDVSDIVAAVASEIRTYSLTHGVPYKFYEQRTTFTNNVTNIGYAEMWWRGYRVTKSSFISNYDIELVTDINNTSGVGVIIKIAPKKKDWSVLDHGSFGAYYLWR